MSEAASADRARVYRALARLFQPPDAARFDALRGEDLPQLAAALARLGAPADALTACDEIGRDLEDADLETMRRRYDATFEPSGGADRPPNETAFAPRTPQEGLTRTFEMADIAGFYRAFGVEVTPGTERVDHIVAELEFMHLLAVKELLAGQRGERERMEICRDASAAFLEEHLGRWSEAFAVHLETAAQAPLYRSAGRILARFVVLDRARVAHS